MKKLLTIIAFMTIAIAANAATYNWDWKIGTTLTNYAGEALGSDIVVTLYASGVTDPIQTSTTNASGMIDVVTFATTTLNESSYTWYFTYEDATAKQMFTSGTLSASPTDVGNGQIAFTQRQINKGTWASTSGNVPEPTSGLLLLCGLAGLALRRKRA